jgi:hypothetical protein
MTLKGVPAVAGEDKKITLNCVANVRRVRGSRSSTLRRVRVRGAFRGRVGRREARPENLLSQCRVVIVPSP